MADTPAAGRCSRATPSGTTGDWAVISNGCNFFWCLRDPAGNFSGYNSDRDTITDDKLWTPGTWEPSLQALYAWGSEVPASMLTPR